MEPFVAEMWRRQTPTEWFNYDALHNAFEKTAQKAPPSQNTSDEYIRKCDDSLPNHCREVLIERVHPACLYFSD